MVNYKIIVITVIIIITIIIIIIIILNSNPWLPMILSRCSILWVTGKHPDLNKAIFMVVTILSKRGGIENGRNQTAVSTFQVPSLSCFMLYINIFSE